MSVPELLFPCLDVHYCSSKAGPLVCVDRNQSTARKLGWSSLDNILQDVTGSNYHCRTHNLLTKESKTEQNPFSFPLLKLSSTEKYSKPHAAIWSWGLRGNHRLSQGSTGLVQGTSSWHPGDYQLFADSISNTRAARADFCLGWGVEKIFLFLFSSICESCSILYMP